jgi:hypothetical protein
VESIIEGVRELVRRQLLGFRGTFTAGSSQDTELRLVTGENRLALLGMVLLIGLALGLLLARR